MPSLPPLDLLNADPARAWSPQAQWALLDNLYDRLPVLLTINTVVALVLVLVLAGVHPLPWLLAWLLLISASLGVRVWHWHGYRRSGRSDRDQRLWTRRLTFGAGSTGLCWGLAGLAFYDPTQPTAQIFVPFVLAGMAAGSMTALTGYMPAFLAFTLGALAPYALGLMISDGPAHLAMAGLIGFFIIGLTYLGRTIGLSLRTSVWLATERSALAQALQERSAQLEATIDGINQGVAVFDRDSRLLIWNQRHQELHGYPERLYQQGRLLTDFLDYDLKRPLADATRRELARLTAPDRRLCPEPLRVEQCGAGDRVLEVEFTPMGEGGFVSTASDITELKRDAARMLALAHHDPLTGLPNRLLFDDRLAQALARCRREELLLAVMLLDLDGFKEINDLYGHRVGDRVLQDVALRLRHRLRESDTVARLGGDEFALILPDVRDPEDAAALADKLLRRLQAPLAVDGQSFGLHASLGVAIFPTDGDEPEQLLENADLAMYRAKGMGGGFSHFAAPAARARERRLRLERDVGRALAAGELSLEYQPQIDLPGRRVVGAEALLRWHHPTLRRIDTPTVIAAAEASGHIVAIGRWALAEACRAAARWPVGPVPLRVAVNVSVVQLRRPELIDDVARILNTTGLAPERLELELIETTAIDDLNQVAAALTALRALGVRVALDDFGTGYASLSHLQQLPLDAIKIDRSFVAGLAPGADEAIVPSIIDLAHRLRLRVTAEGVESAAQLACLAALGCDEAQGHAVGRPLVEADLEHFLQDQRQPLAAPAGQ